MGTLEFVRSISNWQRQVSALQSRMLCAKATDNAKGFVEEAERLRDEIAVRIKIQRLEFSIFSMPPARREQCEYLCERLLLALESILASAQSSQPVEEKLPQVLTSPRNAGGACILAMPGAE